MEALLNPKASVQEKEGVLKSIYGIGIPQLLIDCNNIATMQITLCGTYLLILYKTSSICIYNIKTYKLDSMLNSKDKVNYLALSKLSSKAYIFKENHISIWNLEEKKYDENLSLKISSQIIDPMFSFNENYLLYTYSNELQIYCLPKQTVLYTEIKRYKIEIFSSLNCSQSVLFVGVYTDNNKLLCLYNIDTNSLNELYSLHKGIIRNLIIKQDDSIAFIVSLEEYFFYVKVFYLDRDEIIFLSRTQGIFYGIKLTGKEDYIIINRYEKCEVYETKMWEKVKEFDYCLYCPIPQSQDMLLKLGKCFYQRGDYIRTVIFFKIFDENRNEYVYECLDVHACVISPDCNKILCSCSDYSLRMFSLINSEVLSIFVCHSSSIIYILWEDKFIITFSRNDKAVFWQAEPMKILSTMSTKQYKLTTAKINSTEEFIAFDIDIGIIKLKNLITGKDNDITMCDKAHIADLAFTKGNYLIVLNVMDKIYTVDLFTFKTEFLLKGYQICQVPYFNESFIFSYYNQKYHIYEITLVKMIGNEKFSICDVNDPPDLLMNTYKDTFLIYRNSCLFIYSLETLKCLNKILTGNYGSLMARCFNPYIAIALERCIKLQYIAIDKEIILGQAEFYNCFLDIRLDTTMQYVATKGYEGIFRVWDLHTKALKIISIKDPSDTFLTKATMTFSKTSKYFITSTILSIKVYRLNPAFNKIKIL